MCEREGADLTIINNNATLDKPDGRRLARAGDSGTDEPRSGAGLSHIALRKGVCVCVCVCVCDMMDERPTSH